MKITFSIGKTEITFEGEDLPQEFGEMLQRIDAFLSTAAKKPAKKRASKKKTEEPGTDAKTALGPAGEGANVPAEGTPDPMAELTPPASAAPDTTAPASLPPATLPPGQMPGQMPLQMPMQPQQPQPQPQQPVQGQPPQWPGAPLMNHIQPWLSDTTISEDERNRRRQVIGTVSQSFGVDNVYAVPAEQHSNFLAAVGIAPPVAQ